MEKWTLFDSEDTCYNITTSNTAESINNWVKRLRELTPYELARELIGKMSDSYRTHAVKASKWDQTYFTPKGEQLYVKQSQLSSKYRVDSESDHLHCVSYVKSVASGPTPRTVTWHKDGDNYDKKPQCPCKHSLRMKMPCRHILAVARHLDIPMDKRDYVGNEHLMSTYKDCHPTDVGIHRVSHGDIKDEPDATIQPTYIRTRGCNKLKRHCRFSKGKGKKRKKCSSCGEVGHNMASCPQTKRARYNHGITSKSELEAMTVTIFIAYCK